MQNFGKFNFTHLQRLAACQNVPFTFPISAYSVRAVAVIGVAVFLLAQPLNGQSLNSSRRHFDFNERSIWFRANGGLAGFNGSVQGIGAVIGFAVGGVLNPRTLIGGEASLFQEVRIFDGGASRSSSIVFLVEHFPSPNSSAFVRGGIGVGRSSNDNAWSGSLRGGIGYHWPLNSSLAIRVAADLWQSFLGGGSYSIWTLNLGLALK